MCRVTIWTIESDNDREVVKCLADKLANYLGIPLKIRAVGRKAFSDVTSKIKRDPDALAKAVRSYLQAGDHCVIFVTDSDSPIRLERRRKDVNSAISQIERAIGKVAGQAHLVLAKHELEAWLLIDCVGICCYFAGVKNSAEARERQTARFQGILRNYSRGDTELIVEAEAGGRGPKEYLMELSERVLQATNPQIETHTINQKKYRESLSPQLAEYIEIDGETLKRNASLRHFGEILVQCCVAR